MSVVDMSFIVIVEDFVRFADRLELDLRRRSFRFGKFVWVT